MTAIGTYRKCYRCSSITADIIQTKCKCGGFLYLISQIYTPEVAKKAEDKKA